MRAHQLFWTCIRERDQLVVVVATVSLRNFTVSVSTTTYTPQFEKNVVAVVVLVVI